MTASLASANEAIKKHYEIRQKRLEFEQRVQKLKRAERALIDRFVKPLITDPNLDIKNLPTDYGTAVEVEKQQFKVHDREAFEEWIIASIESENYDVLNAFGSSVLKGYMKQYALEHDGKLPPGVEEILWSEVEIRAPRGGVKTK